MKTAKERLKEAFTDYMRVKPYDKIKVSELIKTAGVNRSTFYRHYADTSELFYEMCSELVDSYVDDLPTITADTDMLSVVAEMYQKAAKPQNADYIRLLAGTNGSGTAALMLRKRFAEKLTHDLESAGELNERARTMVMFNSDFLTITAFYLLHGDEFVPAEHPEADFTYDYTADPVDELADILKNLYGGSSDVHIALFLSTIKLFSKGDARTKPVTELLSYSGFSRTIFYKLYDDRSDYFRKLEDALNFMMTKAIIPVIIKDDVKAFEVLLDQWDHHYMAVEQKALRNAFRDGYAFRLAANIVTQLYCEYIKHLTQTRGAAPDEKTERRASFFITSIVCCLAYYYATLDRAAFYKRLEILYSVKHDMNI